MKFIVYENERAFLFRNGVYKKMLNPGRHRIRKLFGETTITEAAEDTLEYPQIYLNAMLKDAELEKCTVTADVPDEKLAVRFKDGRIDSVLEPGRYVFWNISEKNTFKLIDTSVPEDAGKLPAVYMNYIPSDYIKKIDVGSGEAGLLFYDGAYQKTLPAGRYFFWNCSIKVSAEIIDTRVQQLDIAGQEILTADKVSLRVNFACSYQVTDPVSASTKLSDFRTQLYVMTQLVLRDFIGRLRFDELLRQKDSIGSSIFEKLKETENDYYVSFSSAGIKDIILPGEIRDIMNTVLAAEKSAQASVITRREETAAARSLLDTAKLMDENATLFRLKELEYLERICDKVGSVTLNGGSNVLDALRRLVSGND